MASAYLKRGNMYQVTSRQALDLHDKLPAGNYLIKQDPHNNYFLDRTDDFVLPTKMYGDTVRHTTRILTTFGTRRESTGCLLTGEKGSGKTLLAKSICHTAATHGNIPTIMINAPWCGEGFNALIQSIEQPAVVLFDEFEKVYDQEHQPAILTLLDGVFPSKKLFILTCNDKYRIDQHMRNRPGRIFYMLDFDGLNSDFIREYCKDNLKDTLQMHVEKVIQIAGTFSKFNFDMLKALVEEMNRFDETPVDALKMLNVKAEFADAMLFTYELYHHGKRVPQKDIDNSEDIGINPLQSSINLEWNEVIGQDKDGDDEIEYHNVQFSVHDLKKIENNGARYVYSNANGFSLILNKKVWKAYRYDYDAL